MGAWAEGATPKDLIVRGNSGERQSGAQVMAFLWLAVPYTCFWKSPSLDDDMGSLLGISPKETIPNT